MSQLTIMDACAAAGFEPGHMHSPVPLTLPEPRARRHPTERDAAIYNGQIDLEEAIALMSSEGKVIDGLVKCIYCAVERPPWAFSVRRDKRPGRKPRLMSACRGCNSGTKHNGKSAKRLYDLRAVLPHEILVAKANDTIDRIAKREKRATFSMDAWVRREADASKAANAALPPIEPLTEDKRSALIDQLTAELEAAEIAALGPVPSGGALRAARRRARKSAVDKVDKDERAAKREAMKARKQARYAAMDAEEILKDAFTRTVKALRRARGRAAGNRKAHAAGTYSKTVTIRPPKKGVPWQFTESEIRELLVRSQLRCEVSGVPFDVRDLDIFKPRYPFSPSLDQVDPSRGYVASNARLVCLLYNLGKNDTNDVLAREHILMLADGIRAKAQ